MQLLAPKEHSFLLVKALVDIVTCVLTPWRNRSLFVLLIDTD